MCFHEIMGPHIFHLAIIERNAHSPIHKEQLFSFPWNPRCSRCVPWIWIPVLKPEVELGSDKVMSLVSISNNPAGTVDYLTWDLIQTVPRSSETVTNIHRDVEGLLASCWRINKAKEEWLWSLLWSLFCSSGVSEGDYIGFSLPSEMVRGQDPKDEGLKGAFIKINLP